VGGENVNLLIRFALVSGLPPGPVLSFREKGKAEKKILNMVG
jgi:hypothetical protein